MTLKEALMDASNQCHQYMKYPVYIYLVRSLRLGELTYTTAFWARAEGRPMIAQVQRPDIYGKDNKRVWTISPRAHKREREEIQEWASSNE